MRTVTEQDFLSWAKGKGLAIDPRYPESAILKFEAESASRFWEVPGKPERRPYFLASLLDLMGDWKICYVWRHLGSWPDAAQIRQNRINDVVEMRILEGLGLPLGTAAIVEFDRNELASLITLLFSTTIFGWSVGEDLYVVPDHAKQMIQTDHHDVIWASFSSKDDLQHWVSTMSAKGFDLPKDLPDPTFKRPDWIPPKSQ